MQIPRNYQVCRLQHSRMWAANAPLGRKSSSGVTQSILPQRSRMRQRFCTGNLWLGAEKECGQQQMSLQGLIFKGNSRTGPQLFSLLANKVWTTFIRAERKHPYCVSTSLPSGAGLWGYLLLSAHEGHCPNGTQTSHEVMLGAATDAMPSLGALLIPSFNTPSSSDCMPTRTHAPGAKTLCLGWIPAHKHCSSPIASRCLHVQSLQHLRGRDHFPSCQAQKALMITRTQKHIYKWYINM